MEEEAEADVGEFEDEDLFDDAGTAAAAALSAEEAAAREKARRELAEKFHVKLERQFVLRLPPDAAHALRQRIREAKPHHHRRTQQQTTPPPPPALRMRFASDREGVLRVAGVDADFRVSVADLPCVVEAYKTADCGATLYKAGDVAQMLVARRSSDDDAAASSSSQQQPYDERYRLASGLTPPTKNVRRSFRKPRDREEVQQIESDLLRAVGMAPNAEQAELEEVEEYEGEELDQRAEDALQVPESELAGLQQQQQQQQQSPTPQQQHPAVSAAMPALSAPAAKRPRLPSGAAQLRGVVAPVLPSDEFAPVPLPLPPPPALHRSLIVAPQSPQQQIQLEARRRELLLSLNQWRDKAQALLVQMNTASMEERPAVQAQVEEALRQVQEKHAELDMIRPVQSRSTSPAPFAPSAPPPAALP